MDVKLRLRRLAETQPKPEGTWLLQILLQFDRLGLTHTDSNPPLFCLQLGVEDRTLTFSSLASTISTTFLSGGAIFRADFSGSDLKMLRLSLNDFSHHTPVDMHLQPTTFPSIVEDDRLTLLNACRTTLRATNRCVKRVLPAALALSGYRLDSPVILFLGDRFDRCVLLDLPITFFTGCAVGDREPFHVAHVELAKVAKGNRLDLAALVTAEKMKEEPSAAVRRESTPTIQARACA
jgi:hypothetical protein